MLYLLEHLIQPYGSLNMESLHDISAVYMTRQQDIVVSFFSTLSWCAIVLYIDATADANRWRSFNMTTRFLSLSFFVYYISSSSSFSLSPHHISLATLDVVIDDALLDDGGGSYETANKTIPIKRVSFYGYDPHRPFIFFYSGDGSSSSKHQQTSFYKIYILYMCVCSIILYI